MRQPSKFEIQEILKILAREFPKLKIPLKHRNGFELLLAVILSAQCTDARVNTITPILFPKTKPCTPQHILELGAARVKEIIHPCGYFNAKTAAIMGCAEALLENEIPSDFKKLTDLPGVGPKTAQVIQAQWFGMDAFPVDTHIHRICNRLGLANSGNNPNKTGRQVKAIVPKKHWSDLHLRLIFHGRKTCTARKPKCSACPLNQICNWSGKTTSSSQAK